MTAHDITIPPEALEAAAKILHAHAEIFDDVTWEDLSDADQEGYMDEAHAACLAMLRSWPEMRRNKPSEGWFGPYLILPLTQEKTNAEA